MLAKQAEILVYLEKSQNNPLRQFKHSQSQLLYIKLYLNLPSVQNLICTLGTSFILYFGKILSCLFFTLKLQRAERLDVFIVVK